jgi:hypothetical protein
VNFKGAVQAFRGDRFWSLNQGMFKQPELKQLNGWFVDPNVSRSLNFSAEVFELASLFFEVCDRRGISFSRKVTI